MLTKMEEAAVVDAFVHGCSGVQIPEFLGALRRAHAVAVVGTG
jgi:hypothetical protein